jgi:hypothetical protein
MPLIGENVPEIFLLENEGKYYLLLIRIALSVLGMKISYYQLLWRHMVIIDTIGRHGWFQISTLP